MHERQMDEDGKMNLTLLEEKPDATPAREYLAGNLCRCGSYVKILAAVMDARDRLAAAKVIAFPRGRGSLCAR